MSIHQNHRARVKNRYEMYGLDTFDEHQVLELLLFHCIPRRDTNEIAHRLIDRFGSFAQVLDAPIKTLVKVEGVGHNVALYINLIRDTLSYYEGSVKNNKCDEVILRDLTACGEYMVPYFARTKVETVYMLGLDAKCQVLCCREISKGSVNATEISIRKIVEVALEENVTSVVLAHNHPSGLAIPSNEDVLTTHRVAAALRSINVNLLDHVIVCESDYVSMVASKMYRPDY